MAVSSIEGKIMAPFLILMAIVVAVDGVLPGNIQPSLNTQMIFLFANLQKMIINQYDKLNLQQNQTALHVAIGKSAANLPLVDRVICLVILYVHRARM